MSAGVRVSAPPIPGVETPMKGTMYPGGQPLTTRPRGLGSPNRDVQRLRGNPIRPQRRWSPLPDRERGGEPGALWATGRGEGRTGVVPGTIPVLYSQSVIPLQHRERARPRSAREVAMPERAVGDDRHVVRRAPGEDRVLDRALAQVIEHLIAGDLARPRDGPRVVQVVRVEVADPQARIFPAACNCSNAAKVSSSGCRPGQCSR